MELSLLRCSSKMPLPRLDLVVWLTSIHAATPLSDWYGQQGKQTTAGGGFPSGRLDVQMAEMARFSRG